MESKNTTEITNLTGTELDILLGVSVLCETCPAVIDADFCLCEKCARVAFEASDHGSGYVETGYAE